MKKLGFFCFRYGNHLDVGGNAFAQNVKVTVATISSPTIPMQIPVGRRINLTSRQ